MKLARALRAYEGWVKRSKSEATARVYLSHVRKFVDFLGGDVDTKEITPLDVSSFQDTLERKGYSARSINHVGYAIMSFLEAVGRSDIAKLVPTPPYEAKVPEWLPEDKILEVIDLAERPLDRAILSIGYELAMRREEITLLNLDWYDRKNRTMKVYRLKHRGSSPPEYVLPIRSWAVINLGEYLDYRYEEQDGLESKPLFIVKYRKRYKRITEYGILKIYRRIASQAGVNIPFHAFTKHSRLTNYAIYMIEKHGQADLTVLAKFAGHKNPASTLVYIHLASQYLLQRE